MAHSEVSRPDSTPKPALRIYCRICSVTTMRIVTVLPVLLTDGESETTYWCPTCDGVLKQSDRI
jgi:hypothetical protein